MPAFFDIQKSKPVDKNFLEYSYPQADLFNNGQWEEQRLTFYSSNYYYKITYPSINRSGPARLTYIDSGIPGLYTPRYMYLFSVLHNNITGLTSGTDTSKEIIGELVIEHTHTSSDKKIFLCILLKASKSQLSLDGTTIDNIIKMINSDPDITDSTKDTAYMTSTPLQFDRDIPGNQSCFVYNDGNNKVIVLTAPIELKSGTYSTLISKFENSTDLFNISATNDYNAAPSSAPPPKSDNNVLGKKEDNIYIDCQPTGVGLDELQTYNVPIGSAFSKDMMKMDFMKTSVNFFLFALLLILIYFGVPSGYKMLVIDKILARYSPAGDQMNDIKQLIRAADIVFSGMLILYILLSFYYGFKGDGDYTLISNGLFAFIILGISSSLLMVKKLDKGYLSYDGKTIDPENLKETAQSPSTNMQKVFSLISGYFAFLFSGDGSLYQVLVAQMIAFSVILGVYKGDTNDPQFTKNCVLYLIIYIPLFVSAFIFVSQP